MNKNYRYTLANGKFKKLTCPECNKPKHWQRYIDTETGEALDEQYGRCDNQIKCGYSKNPYTDGFANKIMDQEKGIILFNRKPKIGPSAFKQTVNAQMVFIPIEVLNQTLKLEGYQINGFIQNLLQNVPFIFEPKDIEKVISQYYLGTVCHGNRAGAITFPFIDRHNNIRTIQVKQFDAKNHTKGTDFIHSIIAKYHVKKNESLPVWLEAYQKNELKVSCLFGEHLLDLYPTNPIALVEAPKTAIYGTLYFGFPSNPINLIWMAVYNLSSLNFEKCKVLKGRDVYLFPDLSKDGKAFGLWSSRANELSDLMPETLFKVSDLLETFAKDELRFKGADMADVLIKLDWRQFRNQNLETKVETMVINVSEAILVSEKSEKGESLRNKILLTDMPNAFLDTPVTKRKKSAISLNWDNEIVELEHFFRTTILPTYPIKLKSCGTITNIASFSESHIEYVKANNGNKTFLPYLNRLIELKQILSSE